VAPETRATYATEDVERQYPLCSTCGAGVEPIECETCGGEQVDGHDCGEDCCMCLDPEDNLQCDTCQGKGGWWRCEVCDA
jgi:hypothetical protein